VQLLAAAMLELYGVQKLAFAGHQPLLCRDKQADAFQKRNFGLYGVQ